MQLLAPTGQTSKLHSAGIGIAGTAAGIALLYFGRAFWITLVVSVILAFLLEPFVGLFIKLRLPRKLASFLVCAIALIVLYLAGLGAVTQLASLADDLPVYSQRINQLVDTVAEQLDRAEADMYRLLVPRRFQNQPAPDPAPQPVKRRRPAPPPTPAVQEIRIREDRPTVLQYLAGYVTSAYQMLLMISFIPFLVYFMLSWRAHIHRSILAIYGGSDPKIAGRSLQAIATMARAYVVGNVILGLLIAVVTCVILWTWNLPYWLLLGLISGFLSLIPYVGLPLAVIPPLAGALMTYTNVTPFLIITGEISALHLLALNLLYPAVVGARVHLNPLAVTIALMFWGSIWGGIGLVLAIPITAAVKAVLDNNSELEPYSRLLSD